MTAKPRILILAADSPRSTCRADAGGDYRVGTSPLWRLGKKVLGFSVPMRFHASEPFHAGMAWQMMDVGLRRMAASSPTSGAQPASSASRSARA